MLTYVKKLGYLVSALVLVGLMTPVGSVQAKSYKLQREHDRSQITYDCSVTKKPDTPKWLWYRYPDKKHPKRDRANNGKVHLIWEDSDRAHVVDIRYKTGSKKKTIRTEDDAQTVVKNLKNGKVYTFQVRGISNCGKSGWSEKLKVKP